MGLCARCVQWLIRLAKSNAAKLSASAAVHTGALCLLSTAGTVGGPGGAMVLGDWLRRLPQLAECVWQRSSRFGSESAPLGRRVALPAHTRPPGAGAVRRQHSTTLQVPLLSQPLWHFRAARRGSGPLPPLHTVPCPPFLSLCWHRFALAHYFQRSQHPLHDGRGPLGGRLGPRGAAGRGGALLAQVGFPLCYRRRAARGRQPQGCVSMWLDRCCPSTASDRPSPHLCVQAVGVPLRPVNRGQPGDGLRRRRRRRAAAESDEDEEEEVCMSTRAWLRFCENIAAQHSCTREAGTEQE